MGAGGGRDGKEGTQNGSSLGIDAGGWGGPLGNLQELSQAEESDHARWAQGATNVAPSQHPLHRPPATTDGEVAQPPGKRRDGASGNEAEVPLDLPPRPGRGPRKESRGGSRCLLTCVHSSIAPKSQGSSPRVQGRMGG